MQYQDLIQRLYASDQASALTNEAARVIEKLTNEVPIGEFVTLYPSPKGTVEFLGRVRDRGLCALKEGDLLYVIKNPT